MKFDNDSGFLPPGKYGEMCFRDVTSPIDPSDHRLDSSGGGKGVQNFRVFIDSIHRE